MSVVTDLFVYSHWRGDQVDSDGNLLVPNTDPGPQGIFHCIDTLVGEAGTLEIRSDLDGLLCELPLDVLQQDGLGVLLQTKISQQVGVSHGLLEVIVGRALVMVGLQSNYQYFSTISSTCFLHLDSKYQAVFL